MNIVAPVTTAVSTASQATATAASNAYKVPSIKAALHSTAITFAALASGFLIQAITDGATSSPTSLIAYAKIHWFGYAIAQVVAPAIRAYAATKNAPS